MSRFETIALLMVAAVATTLPVAVSLEYHHGVKMDAFNAFHAAAQQLESPIATGRPAAFAMFEQAAKMNDELHAPAVEMIRNYLRLKRPCDMRKDNPYAVHAEVAINALYRMEGPVFLKGVNIDGLSLPNVTVTARCP